MKRTDIWLGAPSRPSSENSHGHAPGDLPAGVVQPLIERRHLLEGRAANSSSRHHLAHFPTLGAADPVPRHARPPESHKTGH
jgi:hypothetical protein